MLSRPRDHFASSLSPEVKVSLPRLIRPYAAAEGTPAADTKDVNATADGRMVHVIMAATPHTTRTAFLGCPSADTRDTHPERGSTPSRATAKTRREAAVIAIAVFYNYSQDIIFNIESSEKFYLVGSIVKKDILAITPRRREHS